MYDFPVSILYKSIAGRYRPVRVADGPITARYIFIKYASWAVYYPYWFVCSSSIGRLFSVTVALPGHLLYYFM